MQIKLIRSSAAASLMLAALLCLSPTLAMSAEIDALTRLSLYIQTQQSAYFRELADGLKALKDGGMAALYGMISLSFFYGIFHAAGPGHGKAVIGTYLLSNEAALKRGIALAFLAALMQGITALVLVLGAVHLLGWTRRQAADAVPYLELASYGLIAILGVLLMKRAITSGLRFYRLSQTDKTLLSAAAHTQGHSHDHAHDHDHTHGHDHAHDACPDCGHNHAPDPALLSGKMRLRDTASIILSIGIRPCTGSLLVLIFAESLGLRWAGIFSVLAISLGTAMTVSALAFLAVHFRKAARKLSAKQESPLLRYAAFGVTFAGGLFITALGVLLFISTQSSGHPLI